MNDDDYYDDDDRHNDNHHDACPASAVMMIKMTTHPLHLKSGLTARLKRILERQGRRC